MPSKPWFVPKRHGFGAGMPIAWQGWALLVAFVVVLWLANRTLDHGARIGANIVALVPFTVIAARKTAGGWRWRWKR